MTASAYHVISKEVQNCIFKNTIVSLNAFLDTNGCSGIIISFVQILYSYLRYTDWHVDVLFLLQKQPPRGVFRKKYSENMQQIYRRTHMPKCDFNKVALQLY